MLNEKDILMLQALIHYEEETHPENVSKFKTSAITTTFLVTLWNELDREFKTKKKRDYFLVDTIVKLAKEYLGSLSVIDTNKKRDEIIKIRNWLLKEKPGISFQWHYRQVKTLMEED